MGDLLDWRGNALDLAVEAGGVASMHRHGREVRLATVSPDGVLVLTPAEAVEVAASLVAAAVLAAAAS